MSRSPAFVNVAPVYGSVQRPVSTTQRRVSRNITAIKLSAMSTSARVSWQSPSASIQSRQSSRLYGGMFEGSAAMVRGEADDGPGTGDSLGAVGLWLPQLDTTNTSSSKRDHSA